MSNVRRPLSVLCLLVFLGMPLAAQGESRPLSPLSRIASIEGLLSSAWARLTAPLASLAAATEVPATEPPVVVPPPGGDSRGGWDPEG